MAWVTPPTGTAGTVLTAATWNQVRDDLKALLPLDALAYTSYTPTLTQSATVNKTINYAKYTRIANTIIGKFNVSCSSAGTASNAVIVGMPVTASSVLSTNDLYGVGFIYDSSATLKYRAMVQFQSTTAIRFLTLHSTTDNLLGVVDFTAALNTGDIVVGAFAYEAA